MGNIVWLASYPKSGNTWMRLLLANYLADADQPVDINRIGTGLIASTRQLFDNHVGIESGDLTPREIDRLRPRVYEQISAAAQDTIFMKVHDAFTYNDVGEPVLSRTATRGVIYLIRNPLDVAVSFAHHNAAPIAKTVSQMGTEDYSFCDRPDRLHSQLRQPLLSWSRHVESWVDESGLDIHVVRYEDMKADTIRSFTEVIRYCGLTADSDRIAKAVHFAHFDAVQKQEQDRGFAEKLRQSASFFREGRVGSWREQLTPESIEQLVEMHRDVMQRFDYLNTCGEFVH